MQTVTTIRSKAEVEVVQISDRDHMRLVLWCQLATLDSGKHQGPYHHLSITLPGGIPVPTYMICSNCARDIVDGE